MYKTVKHCNTVVYFFTPFELHFEASLVRKGDFGQLLSQQLGDLIFGRHSYLVCCGRSVQLEPCGKPLILSVGMDSVANCGQHSAASELDGRLTDALYLHEWRS